MAAEGVLYVNDGTDWVQTFPVVTDEAEPALGVVEFAWVGAVE